MTNLKRENQLILAVFPSARGFGYVVFEGSHSLIDWGTRHNTADKNAGVLEKIEELLEFYGPDTLVLEDYRGDLSRRTRRIEQLIDAAAKLAQHKRVDHRTYCRGEIRRSFAPYGAVNKYQIAQVIAKKFPELGHHLPPPRKIWMNEDPRMSIFDAAALALTFFHTSGRTKRAA
jgi:Holliday junction resolvasome RuvABC endonuclease subunit